MRRYFLFYIFIALFSFSASAEEIDMNTAEMQALDKITGRVSIINVPVGGAVQFGTFSVIVRSCKKTAEGEVPEDFAFVDVTDQNLNKEEYNIFKGWMMSSSPAVNAVEHPIYDVWLLKCYDMEVNKELLLTEDELQKRDYLPSKKEKADIVQITTEETFIPEETQIISFKDEMYKEDIKPELQNADFEKTEGMPQNLLNINEDYESEEEIVQMSDEDFEKALKTEVRKLSEKEKFQVVETPEALSEIDEEENLQDAIEQELQQVF